MHGLVTKKSYCPYCGEPIELVLDTSVSQQRYIEDCQVCCRPITISLEVDSGGFINLQVQHENE